MLNFKINTPINSSFTELSSSGNNNNILTETLLPSTDDISLGSAEFPFSELFVSTDSILFVDKSNQNNNGSISLKNGNFQLKTLILR